MKLARPLLLLALVLPWLGGPAAADVFSPVTEAERALTAVPGAPNAPAAVLFKKSEFLMMGYGGSRQVASSLLVQERRKILTEQGKDLAQVEIHHSSQVRLNAFKGRTVLPDGRVLPLAKDARFERKASRRRGRSVTTVTFPGVEVGAILDYRYELRFESIYFLEPWYLSDSLPVLHAEILFKIPQEIQAQSWSYDPFGVGIQSETRKTPYGSEVRVWADNLPWAPDEPYGVPAADLATTMMMMPVAYDNGVSVQKLLDSWSTVCKRAENEIYGKARRRDGGVEKKSRELAAGAASARAKAEALYRFVRDEIETVSDSGVFLAEGSSVEKTLAQRRGDYAEKALLLQALLHAQKLDARPVWAAHRWGGPVNLKIANPASFDTVLVAVDLEGGRVYLDPSDRALAFGRLSFGYEGMPALVVDAKKPEEVELPVTPVDQNRRQAVVELALDAEGRLAGKGEMSLSGHHAWERIHWQPDDAATQEAWKEWLGKAYPGFQLEEVQFREQPDEQAVRVTWSMKQREEEVLGDESSLVPSRPLGPTRQPFVQEAAQRRSPVLFPFADQDEVELRLRWPEGWKLESQPKPASTRNRAGALAVSVEVNEAERSLVYRRRLDLPERRLGTREHYQDARALFAAAETSDAEPLSLVRR